MRSLKAHFVRATFIGCGLDELLLTQLELVSTLDTVRMCPLEESWFTSSMV